MYTRTSIGMGASKRFDVVIVGGGPAGMAAALWCDELGLSACLIEKTGVLGGQLSWIHNPISNYPGVVFSDGAECLEQFETSLSTRSFELYSNTSVFALDVEHRHVISSVGIFAGDAIVVATGVRRRTLDVPGEVVFRDKGLLASSSRDRRRVEGKAVAVVGGGDAALENAIILSEFANKVYLVHRRDRFSARKEFVDAVAANERIEVLFDAIVQQFGGEEELEFVDIRDSDGASRRLAVSHAVVRIGVTPNSEFLAGLVGLDNCGYVQVDHLGQTSVHGVYAIGDVAFPVSPTIATAAGSAATAIKAVAAASES